MINPDWHGEEYGKNIALKNFRRNCFIVLHLSQLKNTIISFSHILLLKQRLHRHTALEIFHRSWKALVCLLKSPVKANFSEVWKKQTEFILNIPTI